MIRLYVDEDAMDQDLVRALRARGVNVLTALDAGSVAADYFIGETAIEATRKAQAKHPNKIFFLGRIGYRTAYTFKGRR